MDQAHFPWRPLGTLLVEEGLVGAPDLERALEEQRQTARLLGQILVARRSVTGAGLARVLARQHGVELGQPRHAEEDDPSVPALAESHAGGWRPLGRVLVQQRFVSETELGQALTQQRRNPDRRLGEILVDGGYLTGVALAAALAEQHGVPGTENSLDAGVETIVLPVAPGQPSYEVWAVSYEPGHVQRTLLYAGPNFLEAADFACDYVDVERPEAVEIQRRTATACETVWTYSQERATALESSNKSLVETYGFDPARWNARI